MKVNPVGSFVPADLRHEPDSLSVFHVVAEPASQRASALSTVEPTGTTPAMLASDTQSFVASRLLPASSSSRMAGIATYMAVQQFPSAATGQSEASTVDALSRRLMKSSDSEANGTKAIAVTPSSSGDAMRFELKR